MAGGKCTFILGGASSGKSAYAEGLSVDYAGRLFYIATAHASDPEMSEKISRHRARRSTKWTTIEEPISIVEPMARVDAPNVLILVDCLTLWLSNVMLANLDIIRETEKLVEKIMSTEAYLIFVSNEVGSGIVPDNVLAREFRHAQGVLNQAVAAEADEVFLITDGLPINLKG